MSCSLNVNLCITLYAEVYMVSHPNFTKNVMVIKKKRKIYSQQ